MPIRKQPENLLADARNGCRQNARVILLHRGKRLAFDFEAEPRGELDGAHHAHGIFLEADFRIADRADDPLFDVLHAADVINYAEILDVVEKAVDGEVAAVGVGFGRTEGIVFKRTFAGVLNDLADRLGIAAEGGRLDDLLAEADMREPEAAPDQKAVAERVLDLGRFRARADVEILGRAAEQQVAHAAAHEISGIAEIGKPIEYLDRVGVDIFAGNAMLRPFIHGRTFFLPLQKIKHG